MVNCCDTCLIFRLELQFFSVIVNKDHKSQFVDRPSVEEASEFLQEIEFMKGIGVHENVIGILGCCTKQQPLCLIVEYLANGDLQTFLRKLRKQVSA